MTIPFSEVRKEWRKNPGFMKAYDDLAEAFDLAKELIQARVNAGLSQQELAERMGRSQPVVARLESSHKTSLKSLERYVKALGMKVKIQLAPE
ncbi:MAG: helix-turn-helix transcriptional regulator [Magnetococcales bacterium]|nr:helix-turn-helix transcriptional regulator [Magnetococcales bacterium]